MLFTEIYDGTGCEVLIGTIQSYLRFGLISLKNPNEFINRFSKNLSDDAENNSGSFIQKQLSEWENLTSSISN